MIENEYEIRKLKVIEGNQLFSARKILGVHTTPKMENWMKKSGSKTGMLIIYTKVLQSIIGEYRRRSCTRQNWTTRLYALHFRCTNF